MPPLRLLLRRPLAALLLSVLLALPAGAAAPWEAPSFSAPPEELAREAARRSPPADAAVDLLLQETHFAYGADGLETMRVRTLVRLLTPEAVRAWGGFSWDWDLWHEERPQVRVRVIQPDGRVQELDPSTLTEGPGESSLPDVYTDARELKGPLPGVRVGALVEQEVVVREKPSLFQQGYVRQVPMGLPLPVALMRLTVTAPTSLPLKVEGRALPRPLEVKRQGGVQTLQVEVREAPVAKGGEPSMPPDVRTTPAVLFSTGKSWETVSRAYGEVVDGQLAGAALAQQARAVVGAERDPRRATNLLAAWMHGRVRYTGLHFGALAVVPRSPAEVLESGYGDCKDLATLMVGLLRAVGFPAHVALVRASGQDVAEALPGFTTFDHAIVAVGGRSPFFLDATAPNHPAGVLPAQLEGRWALVAGAPSPLRRLPLSRAEDNLSRQVREVRLAEIDEASVRLSLHETGELGAAGRGFYRDVPAEQLRERMAGWMKSLYGCAKLEDLTPPTPAADAPLTLSLTASTCSGITTGDDAAEVALGLGPLFSSLPAGLLPAGEDEEEAGGEEAAVRAQPLRFSPAHVSELVYRVVPPPGFRAGPLPANQKQQLGPASIERSWQLEKDGTVVATFRLHTGPATWSAAQVEAFRTAWKPFGEEQTPSVRFESEAAALLAAGKVREALEAYRALALLHPKEGLHALQLARALLQAGFGEAARAQAQRAVALEPGWAAAHRVRAWILQHDALGRRFQKGWDREGAIAAYRKCLELTPEDATGRMDLAIVLEHDAQGVRYGPGADLPAAIAEYRHLRQKDEHAQAGRNLLIALWKAGRTEEALALSKELEPERFRNQLRVAALALAQGVPAALTEASRLVPAGERAGLLQGAGAELLHKREYPLALAFMRQALQGAPDAAQQEAQLALLGRLQRAEEVALPPEDPRATVAHFVGGLITGAPGAELVQWLARETRKEAEKDGAGAQEVRALLRQQAPALGASPLMARDTIFSAMPMHVEGSAATGWKVSVQTPGMGTPSMFLVQEEGRPRILTAQGSGGSERAELAAEALRRLEARQLEAARQWLGWARGERVAASQEEPDAALRQAWPVGGTPDADALRVQAAWLMAFGSKAQATKALPLLQAALRTAPTPEQKTALTWGLAAGLQQAGRHAEALPQVESLLSRHPSSLTLYLWKAQALGRLGRLDEAVAWAEKRVAEQPTVGAPLELAAGMLSQAGQLGRARQLRERLVSERKADAGTYNNLAWGMLFEEGASLAQAVEWAQESNRQTKFSQPAYLHTLATLEAEQGRGQMAWGLLMKALSLLPGGEPRPHDWYVVGRVAESYGLPEVAREAYRHALEEKPGPTDTGLLARRRLDALGPAQAGPAVP